MKRNRFQPRGRRSLGPPEMKHWGPSRRGAENRWTEAKAAFQCAASRFKLGTG